MQQIRRPSARFRERSSSDRSIRASASAGAVAGAKDAAELDDNDPGAAWLEHVDDGGEDTPAGQTAFASAYHAAYARAYGNTEVRNDVEQASHAGER